MKFTPREKTLVVALAKTAGSDRQLAAELGIAAGTAKLYVAQLRRKLKAGGFDVVSRYNLISWAKEHAAEMEVGK